MERVLIVSSSEKAYDILSPYLKASLDSTVIYVKNALQARRLLEYDDFDIIVIDTPLSDEFGSDLALQCAENTTSGIILMVKSELAESVFQEVEENGVFVLATPLDLYVATQALRLAMALRHRLSSLKNENVKLKTKIDELKLINRAKYALMQYLKMTEPMAHKYIEKQAMDMRTTKKDIAESIIRTYE